MSSEAIVTENPIKRGKKVNGNAHHHNTANEEKKIKSFQHRQIFEYKHSQAVEVLSNAATVAS